VKHLLVALIITGMAGFVDQGTFATFSASTANGASFSTGTLVLSNRKNNATACMSTNAGSTDVNASDCDVLINVLASDGGTSNARVTITNEGSVDADSLQLRWADGPTPCTTVDEPSEQYHGTGDLCGVMRLQIQEYPTAATQTGNDRGLDPVSGLSSYCWFGKNAGTDTCGYDNTQHMGAFSLFDGVGGNVIDMGPIASGQTRWFRIYLNVPAGKLTNAMQGRRVDFGFTWTAVQA
jgi:hypothetical protein